MRQAKSLLIAIALIVKKLGHYYAMSNFLMGHVY